MGTTSAMEGGDRRGEEGRSRVEGFSEHRRHGRCSSNRTAQALIRFRSQRCRPIQSHTKVKGPKEISDRGEGRTCADQSNRSPRRSPRLRRDLSIGGERRRGGEAKGRRGFKDGNSRIAPRHRSTGADPADADLTGRAVGLNDWLLAWDP
ncbi:hypothetical protein B296_00035044 [Ensete ventricosum]|uniref:Uncharacterized protein n=1 Tax=Ensete ventricosum TaxID=4639 RepID=A0A426ZYN4_ENSVE|nr:hypothetical protein B296_00035044 [Ensete ventricosum]